QCVFDDLSGSVSLSWVGDSTGVILVLTTFQVPLVIMSFGQSKLYRSEDYGKTFKDITGLINNTFIRTEFGMAIGPENSGKVILTGDVSGGGRGGRIFRSWDFARNFVPTELPFHPLAQISYSPRNPQHLLVLSTQNGLWISTDFGEHWQEIHKSVCLAKWGDNDTIFFTTFLNNSCKADLGFLELKKTPDLGKTFQVIGSRIYSFGMGGRFLFASVMTEQGTTRRIHVSLDQGDSWNMAQLPSVGHEQFYSILAANHDLVFMHVDEPGDTGFGTIYTSDERGIIYSKSLERHLYTTTGGETDFTNVTSLRGTFITSVLAEDNSIQSVITFDRGGQWVPLRRPHNSSCDSTARSGDQCSLHIHASYSISQKLNVPMAPLSEPNAVGIVIAHGSVGGAISVMNPDVYISDDGGYSWARTLRGPHHYAILDSGGLLVAIQHTSQPLSTLLFSPDEGQCWYSHTFSPEPLFFTGLASEPGARSSTVSIWGFRGAFPARHWVSYTVDFGELLSRTCESHRERAGREGIWGMGGGRDGWREEWMGWREWRNRENMGEDQSPFPFLWDPLHVPSDFGYYRPENQSVCVEQPELKGHDLEFCLYGRRELLRTSGYRKIPGDRCSGGESPSREEKDMKKKCTSDFLNPGQLQGSSGSSVPVALAVVVALVVTAVAGAVLVKRYVCGGRFLVHRYSVLQQHAEASGVDGIEGLERPPAPTKGGFHDDSDEVRAG
ncbi:SORT protein, partial [Mionectes macconnelli]|nr:SORT protein [Mionectes macconnelli]